MKKIRNIALILLMTLVMVTSVPCVAFAQEEGTNEESGFEVYNGFGELIGTFESLEDAEEYINGNSKAKSSIDGFKKMCNFVSYVVGFVFTASQILEVFDIWASDVSAKEKIAETIRIVVPQSILDGMARDGKSAYLYGTTDSNPYPPHSYQGATWLKANTYYVVG